MPVSDGLKHALCFLIVEDTGKGEQGMLMFLDLLYIMIEGFFHDLRLL